MSTASTSHHVDPAEITKLLAWCRRLTEAGPDADPTERTAYLAAKTDLLARVTNPDPRTSRHDHDHDPGRLPGPREEQR